MGVLGETLCGQQGQRNTNTPKPTKTNPPKNHKTNKMAATTAAPRLLLGLMVLACLSCLITCDVSGDVRDDPYSTTIFCRLFKTAVKTWTNCSIPGGAGWWWCPLLVNAFLNRCSL